MKKVNSAVKLNSLLQPDVALSPSVPDIGFIHRTSNDADIYFLANTSNVPHSVRATFRIKGLQPELWDPFTGRTSTANVAARPDGGITLPLDLEPYESRVIVFSKRTVSSLKAPSPSTLPPPVDLSSNWRVSFGQAGKSELMDRLRSWTENEETRYFSGQATYEKEVSVPDTLLQPGLTLRLDFGTGQPVPVQPIKAGMQTWFDAPVREAAVVYINDRRAGAVWCPPYSLDVTGMLQPGENKIRILVGNLALNYMAGRRLPDYRLLTLRYGERFQAQDMDKVQAVPAGLFGPIRLIAAPKSCGN